MTCSNTWRSTDLAQRYRDELGIEIGEFILSDRITIRRDDDTGVLAFDGCRPGSAAFYEQLASKPFYYMDAKWEFDEALTLLGQRPKETSILEIGCGSGVFLQRCRDAGFGKAQGIEFNARALKACSQKGLSVTDGRIEQLAESGKRFDFVCAFQVLEHVADPVGFVRSAASVLNDAGTLLLCTPNADCFLKRFRWTLLDLPPHHMSRWDAQSYERTASRLNLRLEELRYEPLAKYHRRLFADSLTESMPAGSLRRGIARPIVRTGMKLFPLKHRLQGHTMMAVMTRP